MKNTSKSDSVFRKKGFYIALYSCVGVVLLLAAVISFYGLKEPEGNAATDNSAKVALTEPEIAQTVNPTTKAPYSSQASENAVSGSQIASAPSIAQKNTANPKPAVTPAPNGVNPGTVNPPAATGTGTTSSEVKTGGETKAQVEENKTSAPESKKQDENQSSDIKNVDVTTQKAAEFAAFTEGSVMQWPTFGDIVMNYSSEHGIYDVTLEHYRTNDDICIAAQLGAQVKAAAAGVVKSVANTRENGNTVVIDHGNGWETTYSQLQDSILVAEGDVVKTGQVIGGVGNPSIYSVLLGNHLSFNVKKENEDIDPLTVLAK